MGNIYFWLDSKIILALTGFPGHSFGKVGRVVRDFYNYKEL